MYRRLGAWMADRAGGGAIASIGGVGVGAIHLGTVSAEFSLKDQANSLLGESKKAGIYLKDNGTAGVLQELDLLA